jgi:hypothetical protein
LAGDAADAGETTGPEDAAEPDEQGAPSLTPDQVAQDLLARIDPSTSLTLRTPSVVAGRPCYVVSISPRSDRSTIGEVGIAVDAATSTPLDVTITPRGASHPALDVGFGSVSFGPPDGATFAFTPPPGAGVVEARDPQELLNPGARHDEGRDDDSDRPEPHVPPATSGAEGGTSSSAPGAAATSPGRGTDVTDAGRRVTTVGQDWQTVAVAQGVSLSSPLAELVRNGQPITVGSGQGRLVTTPLINVVVTDDGRLAAGAVVPDVLVAALGG